MEPTDRSEAAAAASAQDTGWTKPLDNSAEIAERDLRSAARRGWWKGFFVAILVIVLLGGGAAFAVVDPYGWLPNKRFDLASLLPAKSATDRCATRTELDRAETAGQEGLAQF